MSITKQISEARSYKKSSEIAKAIALDMTELTGTQATALESEKEHGRRKRDGSPADIGHFIRTTIFKVGWSGSFLCKSDAEALINIMNRSLRDQRQSMKAEQKDFGILESLKHLEELGSKFTHVKEALHELRGVILADEIGILK